MVHTVLYSPPRKIPKNDAQIGGPKGNKTKRKAAMIRGKQGVCFLKLQHSLKNADYTGLQNNIYVIFFTFPK